MSEPIFLENIKEWRRWLEINHKTKNEVWLIYRKNQCGERNIEYLDSVEEALCFGWIDGISKRLDENSIIQRFTPRKPKSHWTELNKERVRRQIALGKVTEDAMAALPDMNVENFKINEDIINKLKEDREVYENFSNFPKLYIRVRISYIQEMKIGSLEYNKRLNNFIKNTKLNKLFGNWNDSGRLIDYKRDIKI